MSTESIFYNIENTKIEFVKNLHRSDVIITDLKTGNKIQSKTKVLTDFIINHLSVIPPENRKRYVNQLINPNSMALTLD